MRRSVPTLAVLSLLGGCDASSLFFAGGLHLQPGDTGDTGAAVEPPDVAPTECVASVGAPEWSTSILWSWEGVAADPSYRHVELAPVSADLDGDGRREIAFVALPSEDASQRSLGYLVVLDGATGNEILAIPDVYGMATRLAVADLDGDGTDEVLASVGGQLSALNLRGTVWTAAPCDPIWGTNTPAVGDMDGDGDLEVAYGMCGILDGRTGAQIVAGWASDLMNYSELVDIDGDGVLDVALGDEVRDGTGAVLASLPAGTERTVPVVGGPAPRWFLTEEDGTDAILDDALQTTASFDASFGAAARACSGDVDGDGEAEVAVPDENDLTLRELDGARVWSGAVQRDGGYPGAYNCTMVDLDADGCLDVVWPQNGLPYVYDAATGAPRTSPTEGAASSMMEPPPILDLDGDGDLEIVLAGQHVDDGGDPTWTGIRAYTEVSGAWIGAAP